MSKMQASGSPIEMLKANHIFYWAANKDYNKGNGLQARLYLAVGAEAMLTYNLWTDIRINNGAKNTVIDFVYKNSEGPMIGEFPEALFYSIHWIRW